MVPFFEIGWAPPVQQGVFFLCLVAFTLFGFYCLLSLNKVPSFKETGLVWTLTPFVILGLFLFFSFNASPPREKASPFVEKGAVKISSFGKKGRL